MKDEKILKNEKLEDEELEKISGGTCYETADDSRFLNVLLQGTKYHHCDRYGATKIWFYGYNGAPIEDVQKSWASLGIKATIYSDVGRYNVYELDGKKISQKEAWAYAEEKVGRHLTREQWDW